MLYLNILSPFICLVVNIVVQICTARFIKPTGLLKSIFAGFTVGLIALAMISSECIRQTSGPFIEKIMMFGVNAIIYLACSNIFFHFVNMSETARRIRLLRELQDNEHGITLDEILQRYNAGEIVSRRINRLIKSGQIICKDQRYFIGGTLMLTIAKIIFTARRILLGEIREFD